jgi:4-amino-4-deoxy-L-arabinose transferase-like glycosyltransferase
MIKKAKKIKIVLILILLFNIVLRVPALFDPVSYGDECIYLTLGNAFNQGLVFYRDIHDNKPPLLYLMAALAGGKLFWLRLIAIFWNTFNVWLIYKLAKVILKKEQAGLVAAFLFVFLSLLPEGRIANGEIFMIMPATLGVLLAFAAQKKKKDIFWILSGLCFSFAFLFKVPIFFDFLALILAFFIFTKREFKDIFPAFREKRFHLILMSFFLPILLSILYYACKGAFIPYVRSALLQNIGYLSSWGGTNKGLWQRAFILLMGTVLIYWWRRQLTFPYYLSALLLLFGLYGVFLSERPYPHYFLEISPWAALLLTLLIFQRKTRQLIISFLLIFLILSGITKFKFWWYPHLPYYQNFLKFALGKISKRQFFSYFGSKALTDYEVAKYLKIHTLVSERAFVWGDGACIYALAQRLPAGKYTVKYHLDDFSGYESTLLALEEKQPPVIVMLESAKEKFPQLEGLLTIDYIQVGQIGETKIYQRFVP